MTTKAELRYSEMEYLPKNTQEDHQNFLKLSDDFSYAVKHHDFKGKAKTSMITGLITSKIIKSKSVYDKIVIPIKDVFNTSRGEITLFYWKKGGDTL